MNKKTLFVAIAFILILVQIVGAFWADERLRRRKGLTHLAEGPQGTLYLMVEDELLKVSPEGRLLSTLRLKDDLGIAERISGICIRPDGGILIGLRESLLIKMYSSDGKFIESHPVEQTSYDFLMTLDNRTNDLYVAYGGPQKGHVQIINSQWQDISTIASFTNPEKPQPVYSEIDGDDSLDGEDSADEVPSKDYLDYFDPADIFFKGDLLNIADYGGGRIIVIDREGRLVSNLPVPTGYRGHTVSIARHADIMYVILWDIESDDGFIFASDMHTGGKSQIGKIRKDDGARFLFNDSYYYPDMVAREGDVLVADQGAVRVRMFTMAGGFTGFFGDSTLISAIDEIEKPYAIYKGARWGLIVGALISLFVLIVVYRKLRASANAGVLLASITAERILGPRGSAKRKIFLILLPGLGQLAAGKKLRGAFFFVVCSVTAYLLASFIAIMPLSAFFLFYVIYLGAFLILLWTAAARDALSSLNENSQPIWNFTALGILKTLAVPIMPACVGAFSQVCWEVNMKANPQASLMVHGFLRELIPYLKTADYESSIFPLLVPANTVISWSLSIGAMFLCIARKIGLPWFVSVFAGFYGIIAGIISVMLFSVLSSIYAGGSFYEAFVYGLFVGSIQLIVFRKRISALVVVAAVAGTGLATLAGIAFKARLSQVIIGSITEKNFTDISLLLGASIRITNIVINSYFLTLATVLVLAAMKKKEYSIDL